MNNTAFMKTNNTYSQFVKCNKVNILILSYRNHNMMKIVMKWYYQIMKEHEIKGARDWLL